MTTILDAQLYAHSERLVGKVVLITGERCAAARALPHRLLILLLYAGGAAGIGRETALQYARSKCVPGSPQWLVMSTINYFHRAKLVLGDLNEPGLEKVVSEIRGAGGYAQPHRSPLERPIIFFSNPSGKPSDCGVM